MIPFLRSRPEKMTPYLRPENLKNLPYFAVHTNIAVYGSPPPRGGIMCSHHVGIALSALLNLPLFFKSKMVAIRFANTKCSFAPRIPPACSKPRRPPFSLRGKRFGDVNACDVNGFTRYRNYVKLCQEVPKRVPLYRETRILILPLYCKCLRSTLQALK